MKNSVLIIGAGLAGSEAAWQLVRRGIPVELVEMRPVKSSPAHHTEYFAELVCSNSLRAANIENAVGLLKEEMRRLGSLIMDAADTHRVPAGGALAVDRVPFSQYVTEKLKDHPLVTIRHEEVTELPDDQICIVASGPLTSDALADTIRRLTGEDYFHFHDAAAPIVAVDSLDMTKVYRAARYGKGGADYLNCPFTKEEYEAFWQALTTAECAELHDFEKDDSVFEGCMPIEVMAGRGIDTMRYGPMKPVGLELPGTGELPYAVVQLRQDNGSATLYNIVGFQTHLKFPEQKRVFSMIPGLEHAEFVRYGVMHRNSYINSPELLLPTLAAAQTAEPALCRPADRRRRLPGIGSHGPVGRCQCGPPPARGRRPDLFPAHGHGRPEPIYFQRPERPFPTDEHQLRPHGTAGHQETHEEERKERPAGTAGTR